MAYNPYESASNILNLKGQWETADEEKRKEIAQNAKEHYLALINNNYIGVADKLQNSDYSQAKDYVSGLGTQGKSQLRDRLYSLANSGKYKGLNSTVIDNALDWNRNTGEVSLGGKPIGKGNLVDGYNYFDTAVIDDAFNNYVNDNGFLLSDDVMYNQGMQDWQDKYGQLWGTSMEQGKRLMDSGYDFDKFLETGAGKGILDYYGQIGDRAGWNQVAKGAGANGGNIDSFSQANAARQNAAIRSQGAMEATNAWNAQREGNRADYSTFNDNMYNLLGLDLTKINRGFDNKETALNNQTDRLVSQAGVTGQPPLEWSDKNNPYLNPDGTVKAQYLTEEFDNTGGFAALYNNPNLSEQDKYYISRARGLKTDLPQYRQYAGEIPVAGTQQTAAVQSDNAVRANERYGFDSQERIADKALASTKDTNAAGITTQRGVDQTNVTIAQIEANLQRELAQMESPAQQIQAIYNSPLPQEQKDALIASIFGGSNNGSYKPKLTAALAKDAYDTGPRTESVINDYNYWFGGGNAYTPEEYPTDPAAIARLEGNNLISLVADYKQLYNSLTVAEKSVIENNLRQTAERYLKNDGKKYGSWEVHSLLKGYGIPDADAKRISGQ